MTIKDQTLTTVAIWRVNAAAVRHNVRIFISRASYATPQALHVMGEISSLHVHVFESNWVGKNAGMCAMPSWYALADGVVKAKAGDAGGAMSSKFQTTRIIIDE